MSEELKSYTVGDPNESQKQLQIKAKVTELLGWLHEQGQDAFVAVYDRETKTHAECLVGRPKDVARLLVAGIPRVIDGLLGKEGPITEDLTPK